MRFSLNEKLQWKKIEFSDRREKHNCTVYTTTLKLLETTEMKQHENVTAQQKRQNYLYRKFPAIQYQSVSVDRFSQFREKDGTSFIDYIFIAFHNMQDLW